MKVASVSETKNNLSALLDRVRHGETILIVDRNRPVARLEPVSTSKDSDATGRLARLERAGVVKRGRGKGASAILAKPPPKPLKGGDILQALLVGRESER